MAARSQKPRVSPPRLNRLPAKQGMRKTPSKGLGDLWDDTVGDFADLVDDLGSGAAKALKDVAKPIVKAIRPLLKKVLKKGQSLGSVMGTLLSLEQDAIDAFVKAARAGKVKLADFLEAVKGRTLDAIRKIVHGLLHAKHRLLDMLNHAVDWAASQWDKLLTAALEHGLDLRTLLRWLAGKTEDVIRRTLSAAFRRFSWREIVTVALDVAKSILGVVIGAAFAAGATLSQVVQLAASLKRSWCELIVRALKAVGKSARLVLAAAASVSEDVLFIVGKTLVKAGFTVGEVVAAAAAISVNALRIILRALAASTGSVRRFLEAVEPQGTAVLKEATAVLLGLRRSLWYILRWAAGRGQQVLKAVFQGALLARRTLADLMSWAVYRTVDVLQMAIRALMAMNVSRRDLIVLALHDDDSVASTVCQAFLGVGASVYNLFDAASDLGARLQRRVYSALQILGWTLAAVLETVVPLGRSSFLRLGEWLVEASVDLMNIVEWAISSSARVIRWGLDLADLLRGSLREVLELVVRVAAELIGVGDRARARDFKTLPSNATAGGLDAPALLSLVGKWLETGAKKEGWLGTKVVGPCVDLELDAVQILVVFATHVWPLIVLFWDELKAHVIGPTTYEKFPETLHKLEESGPVNLLRLPAVTDDVRYLIVSDLHKESSLNICANMGHFCDNQALFLEVLARYSDERYTLISLGDGEEFWYNSYIWTYTATASDILTTHGNVFETIRRVFYEPRRQNPDLSDEARKRFVMVRGNHDDAWRYGRVASGLRDIFNGLYIYDGVVIPWALKDANGNEIPTDVLAMHGQQFDPFNCDEHSVLGKFLTGVFGVLFDVIEFEEWKSRQLAEIKDIVAPFYDRSEWEKLRDKVGDNATLESSLSLDEGQIKDLMRRYGCSIVLGHTHNPKVLRDGDTGRVYANTGTSGWWKHCVWTLEILPGDMILKAWVNDQKEPLWEYRMSEAEPM